MVLPEPLASPAAVLEGPISVGEIEPKNLKTEVALLNSEPNVIEAVPPAEPNPKPAVAALTPSVESVQEKRDGGPVAVPSTTTGRDRVIRGS